jgi:hypothetical protein
VTNNTAYDAGPDWQPTDVGYPRPKGASPMRISLVPGYQTCASPNRTHGAPLSFGSCNPPVQTSTNLTIGTPDSNGAGSNSFGSVKLTAVIGPAGPPDDSDILIDVSISDVRCKTAIGTCGAGAMSDYLGEIQLATALRMTDRFNGTSSAGGSDAATVIESTFPVTVPCTQTVSTTTGSLCSLSTTANTVVPGAVKDGKREIVEVGQVQVTDGGVDGFASTPDNDVFAVQGVFVP